MTLTCSPDVPKGVTTIIGGNIPNGLGLLTRTVPGDRAYVLRGGEFEVTTGGFVKDDSEPPFGVPLKYTMTVQMDHADTLIQRNLVPTPTFLHGAQGWAAGAGRTQALVADPSAHSATVGHYT